MKLHKAIAGVWRLCYKNGRMKEETGTREKIRDTALHLFQQQGYDAVTINAICAASGISKNTFYYYYSEKKDLLVFLFDASKETAHEMMYAIAGISSPYEKLRYIISGTLDYILYLGWAVVRKALELQLAGTKEMGGHGKPSEFGMLILNLFEQAQNDGEIRSDVPASDLMHTSVFLILGAVQIWAVNDGSLDLKKTCLHQFDVLVRTGSQVKDN